MIRAIAGISRLLLLSLVMSGSATMACADNFYANLHAGPRYLLDANMSRDLHGGPLEVGRVHFDNVGVTAGAAGGYVWDFGLALEGEFAYRHNGLDEDVFSGVTTDVDGSLSSYTLLLNAYYRLHNKTDFTPYVGGGVGISLLDLDMRREGEGHSTFHGVDTNTQFAYQGIAGVLYDLAPHWSLGLEYRYFATQHPAFVDSVSGTRVWTETVYRAHEVLLGVTYDFN